MAGENNIKWWMQFIKRFRKDRLSFISLCFLLFMIGVGLFADIIANEKPLYVKIDGQSYFPAFRSMLLGSYDNSTFRYKNIKNAESLILPLVPYSPYNQDIIKNKLKGPFDMQKIPSYRWRHWLGTDDLGRDLLSGMIYGVRYALGIGLSSMAIALFIGLFMGTLSAFYGDQGFSLPLHRLLFMLCSVSIILFTIFESRYYNWIDALKNGIFDTIYEISILIGLVFLVWIIEKMALKISLLNKWMKLKSNIPLDLIINRSIEVTVSIPVLFLIISLVAVFSSSIFLLIIIIGLTQWTSIARFLRAEILRIKELNYIESAQALGYSDLRIIVKHILPNAITPVLISVSFGVASTVLIEASLSFLGIVPGNIITWGVLLKGAKEFSAPWWIAVFPGLAIFFTVTVFNLIGEGISDASNPKLNKA
jgi:peptide/nickel transport system permease protein